MGKASKASKKFQKNHLKRTVDQRRVEQKYRKKIGADKKSKKITAGSTAVVNGDEEDTHYDGMSIDEFMEKGFEVPKIKEDKKNKKEPEKTADHKEDLKDLAEKDPEFYQYLQENDQGLLDFDIPVSDDSDAEEEDGDNEPGLNDTIADDEDDEFDGRIEVTLALCKKWKSALDQNSLRTLKTVLRAFNAAVHSTSDEEGESYKYTVTDPAAFNSLLILALTKTSETIKYHIPLKDKMPAESKKLKAMSTSLKSFVSCLTLLLSGAHNRTTTLLILKSTQELMPYFLSYRRAVKELVNSIVSVWCGSEAEDETRLAAFSLLKSCSEAYPKSLLEMTLKLTYGGIVKSSRKTNIHTMPTINLLKNSAATLYGIDPTISYQQGFQFIRQLAVHLRSGIVNKTPDAYKAIYNWQFVHSLDFWSRVLCLQCDSSRPSSASNTLKELIHPVVQVTLGSIRLIPTSQYFALRFYLTRSLLRLSGQTGVYIPLLPILTEILSSTAISKPAKATTLKPLDFDHNIRANKAYLGTRIFQDGVCDQFVDLTAEFFGLHCKSIAFPELAVPAVVTLKAFIKRNKKNVRFSKQLQRLIEKIDDNTKFISQKRNNVDFGPTNRAQVNAFLKDLDWQKTPVGAYVAVQRQVHDERLRLLRESLEDNNNEEEEMVSEEDEPVEDVASDEIEHEDDDEE